MIGYHYTSKNLYGRIRNEGLFPYQIMFREEGKHELVQMCEKYLGVPVVLGIWVWNEELENEAELGTILYQLAVKKDTQIVKLKLEFDESDVLVSKYVETGKIFKIIHDGIIGDWLYHRDCYAIIVTKTILPVNIKLIKEYDLMKILK